jgi:hypothetical protein
MTVDQGGALFLDFKSFIVEAENENSCSAPST